MKCFNCNTEMVRLHKWDVHRVDPYADRANTAETIALSALKKCSMFRTKSDIVYPVNYVCPECGALCRALSQQDLKHVLRTEQDDSYEV